MMTKMYPPELGLYYTVIGLAGEVGEVSEKVKKIIRDKQGVISDEDKQSLGKEVGDIFWYCAALADELGLSLNDIAQGNIDKLNDRKQRGVLSGSGDNR